MSYKSYEDYRGISLNKRIDRCPNCGFRKNKESRICSSCKEKLNRSKRIINDGEAKVYCQNNLCPTRFLQFRKNEMKEYKQLVFCSDLCLKEFRESQTF